MRHKINNTVDSLFGMMALRTPNGLELSVVTLETPQGAALRWAPESGLNYTGLIYGETAY
jgi:hypothetical protein